MTARERATKAYAEAVNTGCPDGLQKDECERCMLDVIERAIAEAVQEAYQDAARVAFGRVGYSQTHAKIADAILDAARALGK